MDLPGRHTRGNSARWICTGCSALPLLTLVMVNVRGPDSRSTASSWSLVGAMVLPMSISDHHIHVVGAAFGRREPGDRGLVGGDHLGRGLLVLLDGGEDGFLPARVWLDTANAHRDTAAVGDVVAPLAAGHEQSALDLRHVLGRYLAGDDVGQVLLRPTGLDFDQPVVAHQPVRRVSNAESPVVADHESHLGYRGVVLGVERTGNRLVERPAQHVVADVGVLAPAGDALGHQLSHQSSTVIICGRLDGLRGDQLPYNRSCHDAAPGLHPFVGALDEVVVHVQGHVPTSCWARRTTATASASASPSRVTSASSAPAHMTAMDSSYPMPSSRISRAVLTSLLTCSAAWARIWSACAISAGVMPPPPRPRRGWCWCPCRPPAPPAGARSTPAAPAAPPAQPGRSRSPGQSPDRSLTSSPPFREGRTSRRLPVVVGGQHVERVGPRVVHGRLGQVLAQGAQSGGLHQHGQGEQAAGGGQDGGHAASSVGGVGWVIGGRSPSWGWRSRARTATKASSSCETSRVASSTEMWMPTAG